MELLDGRKVRIEKLEELKLKIKNLDEQLGLAVIKIGNDKISEIYIKEKAKLANELDFYFKTIELEENIEEEKVIAIIQELNKDNKIDGILLQLPIPKRLNENKIINAINPIKDIDGLTDINIGKLIHNKECLVPCTPQGIMTLIDYYNIQIEGKNVTIIGRSNLVGKPLSILMTNKNATVTLCHSKTKDLRLYTKTSDIIISAVGKVNLINKEDIKKDAIVIDVGINRLEDGTLRGDINYEEVSEIASYITKVPGGVGQMTVLELANNVYKAHLLRTKK